jgi:D-alanyl-D-alanine carboxypeptidase
VAVLLDDGRLWTGVAGDRQLSPPRPVDPDTVFAIASITKTFVTAAVMQLVDEGKLSWTTDCPLRARLPARQGHHHRRAVGPYERRLRLLRQPRLCPQGVRQQARLDAARDPEVRAGTLLRPGRLLPLLELELRALGLVVEEVTGKDLSAVIRKRLLDPLGLAHTVFQPDEETPKNAAHGHLWGGGDVFYDQIGRSRVVPHLSASTVAWAAGAMAASASDLARWAEALYEGDVVSPESLDAMLTFRKKDEYGLGTRTRTFQGHRAVGHLGGIRGFELPWHFPTTARRSHSPISMFSTDRRSAAGADAFSQLDRFLWCHPRRAHRSPFALGRPASESGSWPTPLPDRIVSPGGRPPGWQRTAQQAAWRAWAPT